MGGEIQDMKKAADKNYRQRLELLAKTEIYCSALMMVAVGLPSS